MDLTSHESGPNEARHTRLRKSETRWSHRQQILVELKFSPQGVLPGFFHPETPSFFRCSHRFHIFAASFLWSSDLIDRLSTGHFDYLSRRSLERRIHCASEDRQGAQRANAASPARFGASVASRRARQTDQHERGISINVMMIVPLSASKTHNITPWLLVGHKS